MPPLLHAVCLKGEHGKNLVVRKSEAQMSLMTEARFLFFSKQPRVCELHLTYKVE